MSTGWKFTTAVGGLVLCIAVVCPGIVNAADAATSQTHKKTKKPVPLPPLPSGPTGPVQPIPLDSMAPVPPQVSYQNGQLTIVAPNSPGRHLAGRAEADWSGDRGSLSTGAGGYASGTRAGARNYGGTAERIAVQLCAAGIAVERCVADACGPGGKNRARHGELAWWPVAGGARATRGAGQSWATAG